MPSRGWVLLSGELGIERARATEAMRLPREDVVHTAVRTLRMGRATGVARRDPT